MSNALNMFHKLTTAVATIFLVAPPVILAIVLAGSAYGAMGISGFLGYVWFAPALVVGLLLVVRQAAKKGGHISALWGINMAIIATITGDLIAGVKVWSYV